MYLTFNMYSPFDVFFILCVWVCVGVCVCVCVTYTSKKSFFFSSERSNTVYWYFAIKRKND